MCLVPYLPIAANVATIVACIVALFTLCNGSRQFNITQKATREAQAIELFIKFNQLNIEKHGSSTNPESDHWYDNIKFAITESIYKYGSAMTSDEWIRTAEWMLTQQETFIKSGDFNLNTYSKAFRDFCRENGYELKSEKISLS